MKPSEMSATRRSSRALAPSEVERVRELIHEGIRREGGQGALAAKLGMRPQAISVALARQEPGVALARSLARYYAMTFEELVSGAPTPKRYQELPGWPIAAAEVVTRGLARRYAVAAAGELRACIFPEQVTPRFVLDLAALWLAHAPLDARRAAETAEADEDLRAAEQTQMARTARK